MKSITKYDDIVNILSDHDFEFSDIDLSDFICVICNKILKNATQSPCGCNFCFKCIQNYLKEDSKVCPSGRICCADEILSLFKDIQIDHKVNRNIGLLIVKCPFKECLYEDILRNMIEHIRICENKDMKCPYGPLGCGEVRSTTKKITDHLHDNVYRHGNMVAESIENITNDLAFISGVKEDMIYTKEMVKTLNIELEKQKIEIKSLKADNVTLSETNKNTLNGDYVNVLQGINDRMKELEMRIETINIKLRKADDFIWKVEEFRNKQKSLLPIFKREIFSNAFYTHKCGYKMRLRIHPNGIGSYLNTHLFLSFCIIKGDFDDVLEWPFMNVIHLSLIDQNTGKDYRSLSFSYNEVSDIFKDVFQKPTDPTNKYLGDDEFIKLDELFGHSGVLKNDSIIVKCRITESN